MLPDMSYVKVAESRQTRAAPAGELRMRTELRDTAPRGAIRVPYRRGARVRLLRFGKRSGREELPKLFPPMSDSGGAVIFEFAEGVARWRRLCGLAVLLFPLASVGTFAGLGCTGLASGRPAASAAQLASPEHFANSLQRATASRQASG